jgi:predicted small secreted protein
MKKISLIAAAMVAAILLAACSGVQGVDDYQGALHKGCTPVSGGIFCPGG